MSGLSRRRALGLGLALAFGAAGLTGCAGQRYRGPARQLRVASGEPGGFYLDFATLLATEVSGAEPGLRTSAVTTGGSLDNIDRLRVGQADLALVLADTAQAAIAGGAPFTEPVPLRALGRVYENYMQLVVRADSPVHSVRDLAGRPVSLGATGSGAALFGGRLFAAAGLVDADALRAEHLSLVDAVTALESGRIDALLWSGGVPTPKLAELAERTSIRLLPLSDALPALGVGHGPVYEQVAVPAGVYRLPQQVTTIGVASLLVAAPSLPDDVAAAVVRVLVRQAANLVPQQALGTQFLEVRTLIGTAGVPLHPGAAQEYRVLHG
ncbi:TAXI family TRAP transporter solute-binding subunit [Goodfellowiella coeruleoviolacea]|uniref:C4-dicarboxylate ABC transporter substrate-binding protein n=1 Tax=Goodfellowiella coeruleoviolacea TaxID=334858 RepID=A0AAE3KEF2_9PSEU|nr:TAXI family TRAP transporter solute-binding subunit [Goodfellowiella coeruleoviolacea]MCP2163790.1 hypothetical protein [Goodfellowiella coeruleoviolacea]